MDLCGVVSWSAHISVWQYMVCISDSLIRYYWTGVMEYMFNKQKNTIKMPMKYFNSTKWTKEIMKKRAPKPVCMHWIFIQNMHWRKTRLIDFSRDKKLKVWFFTCVWAVYGTMKCRIQRNLHLYVFAHHRKMVQNVKR